MSNRTPVTDSLSEDGWQPEPKPASDWRITRKRSNQREDRNATASDYRNSGVRAFAATRRRRGDARGKHTAVSNNVTKAHLLATPDQALPSVPRNNGLEMSLPAGAIDPIASVIVVNVEGELQPAAAAAVVQAADLAGGVGTSKSFHGPVGLVSPYSLRGLQKAQGLAAALDKTRSFGFRYVEFGADYGGLKPAAFKAELDRRGLVPVGLHFSYEQIRDDVEGVAAAAKVMHVLRVGCAGFLTRILSMRGNAARPRRCSIGQRRSGQTRIQLYYHTHGYEFRPFGRGTVFDLLVGETSPKTLMFEMDVAWVVLPGQDPTELIKKYPDRWLLMHVKDFRKGVPHNHLVKAALTDQVPIGSGQVDWPKLLRGPRRRD